MSNRILENKWAILAVVLWSTVATAFKLSLRHLSPLNLLFFASVVSLSIFGLFYLRSFSLNSRNLRSLYLGFLNPFLYYTLMFFAYSRLSAQQAQALNYTWPLLMVLLSIPLLKKRPSLNTFLGLSLGFLGALTVATQGQIKSLKFSDPIGILLGLGNALVWALFWILNLKDKRPSIEKMFWNFVAGSFYTLVALLFTGSFTFPNFKGLFGALYIGLFEMGITFLIWLKAIKKDLEIASLLSYLVPFLSLFFIHFFVGEKIHFSTITGLALILSGIYLGKR